MVNKFKIDFHYMILITIFAAVNEEYMIIKKTFIQSYNTNGGKSSNENLEQMDHLMLKFYSLIKVMNRSLSAM